MIYITLKNIPSQTISGAYGISDSRAKEMFRKVQEVLPKHSTHTTAIQEALDELKIDSIEEAVFVAFIYGCEYAEKKVTHAFIHGPVEKLAEMAKGLTGEDEEQKPAHKPLRIFES